MCDRVNDSVFFLDIAKHTAETEKLNVSDSHCTRTEPLEFLANLEKQ